MISSHTPPFDHPHYTGVQTAYPVYKDVDGNINADTFMTVFTQDILPMSNPYPGDRSVYIFDNASPHDKAQIEAACQRYGVLPLFFFPYAYLYNPVELVFNTSRALVKRAVGALGQQWPANRTVGELFVQHIITSTTPNIACNYFEKCFFPITQADRVWANRNNV